MADKSQDFRIGLTWDETGANAVDRALAEFQNRQMQRAEQYLMASEAQSKRLIAARQQQLQQINDLEEKAHATSVANLERLVQRQDAIRARARKMQEDADRAIQLPGGANGRDVYAALIEGDQRERARQARSSGTGDLYYRAQQEQLRLANEQRYQAILKIEEAEKRSALVSQQIAAATERAQLAAAQAHEQRQLRRVELARATINQEMRLEEQLAQVKARAANNAAQADAATRNQRLANARNVLSELGRNEQELTRIQLAAAQERARIASGGLSTGGRARHTLLDSNMGGRTGRGVGWDFLGGQSFRTIGFQMRAIPGGGVAETLGRLAPLADVAAEVATGTGAASAGVLGLVGGLVAFGVVANAAIQHVAKLTEAYKEQTRALAEGERVALGGTETSRLQRLRSTAAELSVESTLLERRREERDAANLRANTYLAMGVLAIGDLQGAAAASAASSAANQAYDEQEKKIKGLGSTLRGLNATYADTELQTARIIEQEIALSEARMKQWQRSLADSEAVARAEQEIANLRNDPGFTSATAKDMLQSRQQEMALINRMMIERSAMLQGYEDELAELEAVEGPRTDQITRMIELRAQIDTLNDQMANWRSEVRQLVPWLSALPAIIDELIVKEAELGAQYKEKVAARDAELIRLEQLNTQTDMLFEEQTNLGEALERVREATEAYDEALADHQERLAEIDAETQEKREEAYADAADDFAEAEEDAQKKREEQEKEHRDRIAEINRKADRDIANAIANRDALAAYLAEQQRQDDLADEAARHKDQLEQIEEAYDDQKKAIQKRLDEQLEDIEKAAAKARATEQKRFAEQARDLQAAIDKQRSMVQLAEARLDQIRSGFMSGRVIKEYDHQNKLYNIAVAAQDAMLFRTQYFWNAMVDTIKVPGALARGGGGGGTVARMGAAIDRRVDMRLNETFRAAERILIQ